jgi:hypothetical protein
MSWSDAVEAAYRLRPHLPITQKNWAEAYSVLGRNGSAIYLLLTDQAMQLNRDPVRHPGAYFRAMISRAGSRGLNLHAAVFAIPKRESALVPVA